MAPLLFPDDSFPAVTSEDFPSVLNKGSSAVAVDGFPAVANKDFPSVAYKAPLLLLLMISLVMPPPLPRLLKRLFCWSQEISQLIRLVSHSC